MKRGIGAGAVAGLAASAWTAQARATELLGQPTPGGIGLQPAASPLRHEAIFFHNAVLLPVIAAISLFVAGLLVYVIVRFNAKANPTPARFTHNTPIEILWTAAPVLLLMFISIFSFRLLYSYHDMPKPDVTVKVTGNQWYWNYEYPGAGDFAFDSIPLTEAKAEAKGPGLYRLAVDNPMVVPVNKTVQVLTTGADVIHAFFIPAFGVQIDSVPGRVNQAWFRAEREGIYYGQCNELCGTNHSFMPIEVDVVSQAKYDAWVAAHAKNHPSAIAAANTGASPVPTAAVGQAKITPGTGTGDRPAPGAASAVIGPVGGVAAKPEVPAGQPPAAQTGPRGKARTPGAPEATTAGANAANPSH